MVKRILLTLAIMALLLTGLGFMKFHQIESAVKAASFQPPPTSVTTVVAEKAEWPDTTQVVGTVEAVQGVVVSADLPGTVAKIDFDSGRFVHAGDVLVEMDTREERAELAALEAQSELAKVNYSRTEELFKEGVLSRMQYDQDMAQRRETDAKAAETRATIARKTIRAPFSGVLGIRKVNLGQYLSAGTAIVPLQSMNPIYVNFGVPQQIAGQIRFGRNVRITSDEMAGRTFVGRVTAMDSVVDESTRNIQVQATVSNPKSELRPGTFVQVEAVVGASRSVITLPASAINYAPYGDSVYIVTDMKDPKGQAYRGVQQQFVKVQGGRGDQVAIIDGLRPGDEVVSSGVFKLRNGAPVQVNNKVQPGSNPAPKPEDS